jgi:hypothetical protein
MQDVTLPVVNLVFTAFVLLLIAMFLNLKRRG